MLVGWLSSATVSQWLLVAAAVCTVERLASGVLALSLCLSVCLLAATD